MITRAWGTANGQDVILERKQENTWQFSVPWTEDGKYIVTLYAENEAGVIGFFCTMMFVISGHELKCFLIDRGFSGSEESRGYSCELQGGLHQVEMQEGGYEIERIVCGRDER